MRNKIILILQIYILAGCSVAPEKIKLGVDHCNFCKMTISDSKYATEALTKKGKVFKYDDLHCLISDLYKNGDNNSEIKGIYVSDFCGKNELILKDKSYFLIGDEFHSPMGGNVACFSEIDSMKNYVKRMHGKELKWGALIKELNY